MPSFLGISFDVFLYQGSIIIRHSCRQGWPINFVVCVAVIVTIMSAWWYLSKKISTRWLSSHLDDALSLYLCSSSRRHKNVVVCHHHQQQNQPTNHPTNQKRQVTIATDEWLQHLFHLERKVWHWHWHWRRRWHELRWCWTKAWCVIPMFVVVLKVFHQSMNIFMMMMMIREPRGEVWGEGNMRRYDTVIRRRTPYQPAD